MVACSAACLGRCAAPVTPQHCSDSLCLPLFCYGALSPLFSPYVDDGGFFMRLLWFCTMPCLHLPFLRHCYHCRLPCRRMPCTATRTTFAHTLPAPSCYLLCLFSVCVTNYRRHIYTPSLSGSALPADPASPPSDGVSADVWYRLTILFGLTTLIPAIATADMHAAPARNVGARFVVRIDVFAVCRFLRGAEHIMATCADGGHDIAWRCCWR